MSSQFNESLNLPCCWLRRKPRYKRWKLIERKYTLRSITKKQLNVPEKPKLKCLGFTYNGAKLFNMLPIEMRKVEDPSAFKTMTKKWIWENIPSY